jgi:hypothetical protein
VTAIIVFQAALIFRRFFGMPRLFGLGFDVPVAWAVGFGEMTFVALGKGGLNRVGQGKPDLPITVSVSFASFMPRPVSDSNTGTETGSCSAIIVAF